MEGDVGRIKIILAGDPDQRERSIAPRTSQGSQRKREGGPVLAISKAHSIGKLVMQIAKGGTPSA